jgi:hypothetical protein
MSTTFPLHTEGNVELSLDEINHDHYDVDMMMVRGRDYLLLQHLSPDEILAIASKIIYAMCQSHLDKAEVTVANLTKDIAATKRLPR